MDTLVRTFRIKRGWSQAQLAEKSGVTRQTINSLEKGRSVPSLRLALRLGQALGKPVAELICLERIELAPPATASEGTNASNLDSNAMSSPDST